MIADQAVWWRSTGVFLFWCWVIAFFCRPPMGSLILIKAFLLGVIALAVSLGEWSYQFALTGEFHTPRFSFLIAAISTPTFVFWSLISELRLRPKEEQGHWMALLAKDPIFTVFGVLCSAVGVILAIWDAILAAVHRASP
jgi:hypothetical protein